MQLGLLSVPLADQGGGAPTNSRGPMIFCRVQNAQYPKKKIRWLIFISIIILIEIRGPETCKLFTFNDPPLTKSATTLRSNPGPATGYYYSFVSLDINMVMHATRCKPIPSNLTSKVKQVLLIDLPMEQDNN